MPITSALRRMRQEKHKFKTSLDHMERKEKGTEEAEIEHSSSSFLRLFSEIDDLRRKNLHDYDAFWAWHT